MTVIDASAQVNLLLGDVAGADLGHFDGELFAPDLFLVEVVTVLRRAVLTGRVRPELGERLVDELVDAPIELVSSRDLVLRAFQLRDRVSVSDACYVALAEERGCAVLTSDARLARTPGLGVPFTIV